MITYDEVTGAPTNSQDSRDIATRTKSKSAEIEIPWSMWLASPLAEAAGAQAADQACINLVLRSLHLDPRLRDMPISVRSWH